MPPFFEILSALGATILNSMIKKIPRIEAQTAAKAAKKTTTTFSILLLFSSLSLDSKEKILQNWINLFK